MEQDLFSLFSRSAQKHAQKTACQIKENSSYTAYSYSKLHQLALKTATLLNREGLTPQDKVAILLENSPLWPVIYFGIIARGAAAVPLDTKLTPEEINNIMRDSQSKILFSSPELYLPLQDRLKNIPGFKKAILYPFPEILGQDVLQEAINKNKPDDVASLLYTSGTTASPKGVMLTHKNLSSNFESISKIKIINSDDTIVSLLPLHHSYPFMITIVSPLLTGAKIVFLNSLKSEDMLTCLKETQATLLVGVPQLFYLLHKAIYEKIGQAGPFFSILKITNSTGRFFGINLNKLLLKKMHLRFGGHLRFFISGGARLDPKVASELSLLGFDMLEGYGLTETSPVVTFNPPKAGKTGSVGIPVPDVRLRIHNPDKQGVGEVLIQGPNVMKGYYKRPEETSEVFINLEKDGKSSWFNSGDLGFIDKKGYLFLTGRSKEVIVLSSGKNIYPEEIEAHYLKNPYIKEICVFELISEGLSSLHAVVLANTEYFREAKEVNIQGKMRWLIENLSRELPSYKRIMGFTIAREELPKTRLGKLKRYEIKALYSREKTNKYPGSKAQPKEDLHANTELESKIIQFLSRELKAKVHINSHLELDLGIDSLSRVELAIGLEKLLNISIPEEAMAETFTVAELAGKITKILHNDKGFTPQSSQKSSWSKIIQVSPRQEILDKISLYPKFTDKLISFILFGLFHLLFKVFWQLKIEGRENLPKNKPFIICPNHSSYLDGFAVAAGVGIQHELNLFFLGYSGYFQHPAIRWAIKIARLIAIDPAINLTDAMQASAFVLRNKKCLCIFPEGERSVNGELKEFKKGVGILIKETDCLVVPCCIHGSYQAWPRERRLPRPYPVKVIFSRPCDQEELKAQVADYNTEDEYEKISLGLRKKAASLA